MPLYEVSGKWYHLSYSHGVRHVTEARNPAQALRRFLEDGLGIEDPEDLTWDERPRRVRLGRQEPEVRFWAWDDQMYIIWDILRVRPEPILCPTCNGSGASVEYLPLGRPVRHRRAG